MAAKECGKRCWMIFFIFLPKCNRFSWFRLILGKRVGGLFNTLLWRSCHNVNSCWFLLRNTCFRILLWDCKWLDTNGEEQLLRSSHLRGSRFTQQKKACCLLSARASG